MEKQAEILIWQKSTWGNWGQHSNIYTFVIKLDTLETIPLFKLVPIRHENKDSRKNIHRYTYAKESDIAKLQNVIIKRVVDYASSSRRSVEVKYYDVNFNELQAEKGLRNPDGEFYDIVYLPDGRKLRVTKDKVQFV